MGECGACGYSRSALTGCRRLALILPKCLELFLDVVPEFHQPHRPRLHGLTSGVAWHPLGYRLSAGRPHRSRQTP